MTIQEMIARQQAIVTQARNEGRGLTREEQIAEVNEMCEEIKLIRAGKLKGRPAEELLNEL